MMGLVGAKGPAIVLKPAGPRADALGRGRGGYRTDERRGLPLVRGTFDRSGAFKKCTTKAAGL